MKRMVVTGLLLALALAGCSDQSTDTAQQASAPRPQTSSVATAAEPPAASPAPAIESEAVETPQLVVPEAPGSTEVPAAPTDVPTGSDRPHGEQLYTETCQQFIEAIDALAATGVTSREQAALGISDQLQANSSWSTLPPEDQQEMLRGLESAGQGQC